MIDAHHVIENIPAFNNVLHSFLGMMGLSLEWRSISLDKIQSDITLALDIKDSELGKTEYQFCLITKDDASIFLTEVMLDTKNINPKDRTECLMELLNISAGHLLQDLPKLPENQYYNLDIPEIVPDIQIFSSSKKEIYTLEACINSAKNISKNFQFVLLRL